MFAARLLALLLLLALPSGGAAQDAAVSEEVGSGAASFADVSPAPPPPAPPPPPVLRPAPWESDVALYDPLPVAVGGAFDLLEDTPLRLSLRAASASSSAAVAWAPNATARAGTARLLPPPTELVVVSLPRHGTLYRASGASGGAHTEAVGGAAAAGAVTSVHSSAVVVQYASYVAAASSFGGGGAQDGAHHPLTALGPPDCPSVYTSHAVAPGNLDCDTEAAWAAAGAPAAALPAVGALVLYPKGSSAAALARVTSTAGGAAEIRLDVRPRARARAGPRSLGRPCS